MNRRLVKLRFAYGALLLLAPRDMLSRLATVPLDRRARIVASVLGGRELVQAEFLRRRDSRGAVLAAAAVDCLHALSMLALSRLDPSRAYLSRRSAATAAAWGLTALWNAACNTRRGQR